MIGLLVLALQAGGWTAAPSRPTVGDTITLERTVAAPAGWRIRAGKVAPGTFAEPLGDAVVLPSQAPGSWVIRHTVVAWRPGDVTLDMPAVLRLGPDGTADSTPGGTASFHVASVIPDSVKSPAPKPMVGPLRLDHTSPVPAIAGALLGAGVLLLLIGWRRREARGSPAGAPLGANGEIPDARWLAAGEPKAVAARAAHQLRRALVRAVPAAHEALSTAECLAVVEQAKSDAPLRDLRELLQALDQVAFASAHGVDVAPLAARARALARELDRRGAAA